MRAKSISTRFNLALAVIVTALMAAFGVMATTITVERISDERDAKLEN